jgi:hypothetical protein
MLMARAVPHLPPFLPHIRAEQISAIAFCVVTVVGLGVYIYYNRRPDPKEVERQRRLFLATRGRITDAMLVDTGLDRRQVEVPEQAAQSVLRYQYKVGGVGYECSQDVEPLGESVRHVRMDLPIQVRYDPQNPANSIVVAESWSGLRSVVRREE